MAKRLNPNLVKMHRSYSVSELAELLGVDRRTIRNWIKNGLPIIDDSRPILVLGTDIKVFIRQSRKENKRQCKPCEIYCLRCRMPRQPQTQTTKFVHEAGGIGRVFALCRECGSKVNKYFSWRQLDAIRSELQVEVTGSTKTHSCEG
ncbi:helix-turn-helix domain-containing protein [Vibrio parahaemolyticus]|uniref:helix-turn-helix domain-containing protein n=1 Tax=Vibrio parahaemolyticus TaxID=670 RepID=UPI00112153B4|nr:helix-turn-helix domain-containing protein [Vibrio parahaemolyticus]EHH2531200.1 helix-turn-helix domain-containing protein [Vibrio parahaemolyticus]TON16595.1 DNA-binding protein [Vibrio parahaemolyticus]HCG5906989.1 helix-turn-helix domain-containing protein [Vibrio parahaemolyticus]